MITLLLLFSLLVSAAFAWGVRRHRESVAWNRELDQAFGVSSKREMSLRASLRPLDNLRAPAGRAQRGLSTR